MGATARLHRQLRRVGPTLQLLQLVDEEDALALCAGSRFHNPSCVRVLLPLFLEDAVIGREQPSQRDNVHVNEQAVLVAISDRIILLLHFFAEALDVLNHQVFARQLVPVRKVVHYPKNGGQQIQIYLLHVVQPEVGVGAKNLLHIPGQSPVNLPLVALGLLPAALLEILHDCRLVEVGAVAELDQAFITMLCLLVFIFVSQTVLAQCLH